MSKENKKRNQEILKLRKSGLSYRKIGKIYNRNTRTVFDIIKRMENKTPLVDNLPA